MSANDADDAKQFLHGAWDSLNTALAWPDRQAEAVPAATLQIAMAQALLTRRIADALERVAAALERRDVVEVREVFRQADVAEDLKAGWVYLGPATAGEEGCFAVWHVVGRPRNVPPDTLSLHGRGGRRTVTC